ncbi:MAG: hypothetical protein LBP89_07305 [Helicobacteraceae bacterium]|nr:hypothetical protein [Helicobacteraceae bacterium]
MKIKAKKIEFITMGFAANLRSNVEALPFWEWALNQSESFSRRIFPLALVVFVDFRFMRAALKQFWERNLRATIRSRIQKVSARLLHAKPF